MGPSTAEGPVLFTLPEIWKNVVDDERNIESQELEYEKSAERSDVTEEALHCQLVMAHRLRKSAMLWNDNFKTR